MINRDDFYYAVKYTDSTCSNDTCNTLRSASFFRGRLFVSMRLPCAYPSAGIYHECERALSQRHTSRVDIHLFACAYCATRDKQFIMVSVVATTRSAQWRFYACACGRVCAMLSALLIKSQISLVTISNSIRFDGNVIWNYLKRDIRLCVLDIPENIIANANLDRIGLHRKFNYRIADVK